MTTTGISSIPLQLPPEILHIVMEYLSDDIGSLQSAILVNMTWAAVGISIHWRKPPVTALASISSDRRQYYANQIRVLVITEPMAQRKSLRCLKFPRLKRAKIDFGRPPVRKGMKASRYYLQPSLEALVFKNASLAEKSFDLLQSRCPLLRKLHIEFLFSSSDTSRLVKLLQDCKCLKIIRLHYEDYWSDDHLHAYLAGRDGLVELRVQKFIEWKAIKKVFEIVQNPFKGIQDLHLRLPSKAVAPLTAAITSVTHLTLEIQDDEVMVLSTISSLVNLHRLVVCFMCNVNIPGTDISALRVLKNLKHLMLKAQHRSDVNSSTLTMHEFSQMCTGLRGLEHLWFGVRCNMSTEAIILLGKYRQLKTCVFTGKDINLHELSGIQAPLFPRLLLLFIFGLAVP